MSFISSWHYRHANCTLLSIKHLLCFSWFYSLFRKWRFCGRWNLWHSRHWTDRKRIPLCHWCPKCPLQVSHVYINCYAFSILLWMKRVSISTCLFYRYIIGKKGETRKRLESDTKTSISIPKQGVEGQIGKNHLKSDLLNRSVSVHWVFLPSVWQLSQVSTKLPCPRRSQELRFWLIVSGKSSLSHTSCHFL